MSASEKFHNTLPQSISQILLERKNISVPNFQRNYSWHTSKVPLQVPALWGDLFEKFSNYIDTGKSKEGEYLLGPMVFVEDQDRPSNLEIVDGQQRLATLTMIFCIARGITLELYEDQMKQNPGWKPPGLDDIIKLIENRIPDVQNNTDLHESWKLKLNDVDERLFREIIQEYEADDDDQFCNPGDKYKKISKKIEWFTDQLKGDSKDSYAESQILLIEAYLQLYKNIQDALITDFKTDVNANNLLLELEKESEKEVDKDMRIIPGKYHLPDDFFNDGVNGLDVLEKQNWTNEDDQKIHEEHENWNNRKRSEEQKKQFGVWLQGKIARKKREKFGTEKETFSTIRNHAITKIQNKKSKEKRIEHLPRLMSFCKNEIGNCIFSVRIIVKDDEDAFQIFETLNERGQPLSKSNLVKNWVVKKIDDQETRTEFSERWDVVIKAQNDADFFLRESLRSRGYLDTNSQKIIFDSYPITNYPKNVRATNNNLYKIIKHIVSDDTTARKYVKQLEEDAEICGQLDDPTNKYPKVTGSQSDQYRDERPAIIDMSNLNAVNIRLPILTAYRKWSRTCKR